MRPLRLVMENVGPFTGRAELDFTRLGDIFLIAGKTGSGKTTIFDALCYALYGVLPGGRRNHIRKLRSDFAPDSAECSVTLEFELGNKAYRVERKPPRWRAKTRGEGFIEDPEEVVLYELGKEGVLSASGKKSEADERIKTLLGLSVDEFSKIVLLPQGEFAEFLRLGTTERRDVLKKLFPVDLAVRVRELAQKKSSEATTRLQEAERSVRELNARFSTDNFERDRRQAQEKLTQAEKESARLEEEIEALASDLNLAQAEEDALAVKAAALERSLGLAGREQEFALVGKRLALVRSARPLQPLVLRLQETLAAEKTAEQAAREAEGAAAAARLRLERIETAAPERDREKARLAVLRDRRVPLMEVVAAEDALAGDRAALVRIELERSDLERRKAELDALFLARNGEAAGLRGLADQVDALDEAWEQARAAMEQAKNLKPLAERAEAVRKELADTELRFTLIRKELDERRANLAILDTELAELERALAEEENAGKAAALAAGLSDGIPCPVCGSREHPRPALPVNDAKDTSGRLGARRMAREDARRVLDERRTEEAVAAQVMDGLRGELGTLAQRWATENGLAGPEAAGFHLPDAEEATATLARAAAATTEALIPRNEARKARDRLGRLFKETQESEQLRARTVQELSDAVSRCATASASIAEREKRRVAALSLVIGEATNTGASEVPSAGSVLANLEKDIATMEATLATSVAARESAVSETAAQDARAAETRARLAETRSARERAETGLEAALKASPFSDLTALGAALEDAGREAEDEQALSQWKEARTQAQTLLQEAERLVETASIARKRSVSAGGLSEDGLVADGVLAEYPRHGGAIPTAAELAAILETRKDARGPAARLRDEALAALSALDREMEAWRRVDERRALVAKEAEGWKRLSDTLSGNNPRKRSFDAWLLGLYLAEVAAYATKRLERMSEGRYRLLLDADREGGRGLTGLDLAVFDAYTGKSRPCATLSGGESFMASVSLALGLADSIQSRSGGIRLDAVFIDEGFGSLDEASLDKALGILDEIRDHRMVGLISHVPELRNRIPDRVDIIKTASGSRIEVRSGN